LDNNLSQLPDCQTKVGPGPVNVEPRVRRNVATVTQAERDRLRDAIIALNKRFYPGDTVSWWKKQDEIHQATHVHEGPAFLPWHRELTNRFEALLRQVDPNVTLHYWDWQTDPRRSSNHNGGFVDLFTAAFMGAAQGKAGAPFDYLSITREMASRTPRDFQIKNFETGQMEHGDVGSDQDPIWKDDFPSMRVMMEAAHTWAHGYVGGTIRDVHTSFKDPFVFLLHSNVDRLFASWQLRARGDSRLALPGLNPEEVYGNERDTIDVIINGRDVAGISSPMKPWAGVTRQADTRVEPWATHPEIVTSLDPSVVRPPFYDSYAFPLGCSWNAMLPGHLLPDNDVIQASITLNAVDSKSVEFVLEAGPQVTWWKGLRVPDGEGSSWMIETEGAKRRDSVSLWANQVHNGQELIFHKAKFLGAHRIAYRLGDLGRIVPGSRVTFRWYAD
jgi:hypothetical protein